MSDQGPVNPTDPTQPMTKAQRDLAESTAPPAPPAPSPAAQLQAAMDALNHPSVLDVPHRLGAIQNALTVMAAQLMPLLPTE